MKVLKSELKRKAELLNYSIRCLIKSFLQHYIFPGTDFYYTLEPNDEEVSAMANLRKEIKEKWYPEIQKFLFGETLIGVSIILFVVFLFVAIKFATGVSASDRWTEFYGSIFDIFIILIVFGYAQYRKQKRDELSRQQELKIEEMSRQQETIEDFKLWNSEEARNRILGAIRRMNRSGKTNPSLIGVKLSDVRLARYGIESLNGAKLAGGNWLEEHDQFSEFKNVDFSGVDLEEAVLGSYDGLNGRADFSFALYEDCNFNFALLKNSIFDGAKLYWNSIPPDETGYGETDEYGNNYWREDYSNSFMNTSLEGVSFRKCEFKNADFRGTSDIVYAKFEGAKGLETCAFDDEETKQWVIAQTGGDSS